MAYFDDGYDIRSGRESNFVGREREFVFALKVIRRQGRHQWAQRQTCAHLHLVRSSKPFV